MLERTDIYDLGLPGRYRNCLLRAGYTTLDSLKGVTKEDLMRVRSLGIKGRAEIMRALWKHGIKIS